MPQEAPIRPLITTAPRAILPPGLVMVPALALMVFTRHNIGWRFIYLPGLICLALFLCFWPFSYNPFLFRVGGIGISATMLFALAMVALAVWHGVTHLVRGSWGTESPHSYHTGDPHLSFLPVRRVFIVTLIEPLLAFFLGWNLVHSTFWAVGLGICLMVAGVMLGVFGFYESRYQIHQRWADHDMSREADAQTKGRQSTRSAPKQDETLNTGPDEGEAEQPYRRRGR